MSVEIGMPGQSREAVARLLNALLADEHVLYIKLRNYHWNVVGPHFQSLHELFEEQYEGLAGDIDEIAERVRALGQLATGTMAELAGQARLKEQPGAQPDADTMVANLVHDHEAVIRQMRQDIKRCTDDYGDEGTADLLTGLMEKHEKKAWMLRAHIEKAKGA
jgi:starvation-inducible DNA-binding protein